ncbi:MAG: PP2C family protein-serine/threonine phosphatase [Kiritimatiellales bacterium]
MADDGKLTSTELLKQLLDTIDDNIYFKDHESRFILVNKAFARRMGMKAEEVVGKTDFDIFTPEHARPAFEAEREIIKTGEPLLGVEEKETWSEGETSWASTSKMPLRDAEGNIIGTFGISREITEHKLNEIKLHQYARRLTRINKQMEEELRMAANLQQAFLPQFYPDFSSSTESRRVQFFHRYIANTQVSGDLCAINKLNEQEAGMLICDVMGHGVRAALITAIVHTMIGDLTRRGLPPGEFFSEMNRQIRPMLQSQDNFIFVTASYLILNTETGELRGSSAGHTVPFLIRNGSPLDVSMLHAAEHANGPALAVIENAEYRTFHIRLQPGDAVLMYTDGLLEEVDDTNEEFGREHAREVLSHQENNEPKTLCDALIHTLSEFHSNRPFTDDVCLLGFRWNGPDQKD